MSFEDEKATTIAPDILLPAVLAHELRSPIGAVHGFSSLIAQEAYGPIGDKRYIEAARQMMMACRHMESLVENILEISKHENGDAEVKEEIIDLYDLTSNVQSWLQHQVVEAQVIVRPRIGLDDMRVRGDSRRIRQAFLNIMENAIRYTPKGGYIDIQITVVESGAVELTVCNDLPQVDGIQVQHDGASSITGHGLGLYITRSQMQAHGGDLKVFPNGDGRAMAVLSLPASRRITA